MANVKHIIQCLSCGRIKKSHNTWCAEAINPLEKNISHTYCGECISQLQKKLLTSREFSKWEFPQKINHLQKELDRQNTKHDRNSLRNYLEEFYCVNESEFENYYEQLKQKLVPAVCPLCHMEVSKNEKFLLLNKQQMHRKCYREVTQKIQVILDNNWDRSNRLDAYLDLLQIEKNLRPSIREAISKKRRSPAQPA